MVGLGAEAERATREGMEREEGDAAVQGELVVMEVRWEEEEVMLERGSMAARMAASTEVVAVMVALAVISEVVVGKARDLSAQRSSGQRELPLRCLHPHQLLGDHV